MVQAAVDVATKFHESTGGTTAYILSGGGEDGLLVDPAAVSANVTAAIEAYRPRHIAVTHHHPDHVGGVAEYATEWDLTVWARHGRTDAFVAATGITPDREFAEGTEIPGGEEGITVRDTPGHAPEHVAFESDAGLVSGDLAVAEGSVVVGAPEGDLRAYLTSLRRVQAMAPARLFPAHGPRIDDPRAVCSRLLEHRLVREKAILDAVMAGAQELEEVTDRAYEKDIRSVRELAEATAAAHLKKLSHEGKIRWDGRIAAPID